MPALDYFPYLPPIGPFGSPEDYSGELGKSGYYTVETTKRFAIGQIAYALDGSRLRYAKSCGACLSGQGCEFTSLGFSAYTAAGVAASIGDTSITLPAATHSAVAANELQGGYVIIFNGTDNDTQKRMIMKHAASAANAAVLEVELDAALTEAIVAATSAMEVYKNPWDGLQLGASVSLAKAGVPLAPVSATGYYFWLQESGPTWIAPQSGITGKHRGACWRHDGSLDTVDNGVEDNANVTSQYAGYAIAGSADAIGPLFMLQG